VKAYGVYQLFLLWNRKAAQYNPWPAQNMYSYGITGQPFDSTHRLDYVKALQLYDRHERLLDSFGVVKNALLQFKAGMMQPQLNLAGSDYHLPGQPIPVMLRFRNVRRFYVRVVKINAAERLHPDKKINLPWLLQKPMVTEWVQPLPLIADYQPHNTIVKLEGLPAGRYLLLYSDSVIAADAQRVDYMEVTVTRTAVINNDQRVFVLDRQTGFPLENATVSLLNKKSAPKKVNSQGYATVTEKEADSLLVVYHGDTSVTRMSSPNTDLPDAIYDKDDYDDLLDYYEENIQLHLFTDRPIYRPGQTVYYKGIFLVRNPKNGQTVVLNWKNLRLPFFKNLFYRLLVKLGRQKIELTIDDPFSRAMDTIRVIPNKYGSFAGSFVLPKNAATGEWGFDATDLTLDNNDNTSFKVEEYKRPGFELSLQKPKQELYLGDSFPVKLRVRSFAGAALGNVLLKYSVERDGDLPVARDLSNKLLSGQAYTNDQGEYTIYINDSLVK
ncbi:MAG TPA: MG2 domain-containing protein, partial [Chitinophagaceae bacterium]|nr:MG2 domain-containing protein [Chitinophagaceae bacterium]